MIDASFFSDTPGRSYFSTISLSKWSNVLFAVVDKCKFDDMTSLLQQVTSQTKKLRQTITCLAIGAAFHPFIH
jgi:hypothetical protein